MEGHGLFIKVGLDVITNNTNSQVHKIYLIFTVREFPCKSAIIHNGLKHFPIEGVKGRIFIKFPNEEAIVDESFVED